MLVPYNVAFNAYEKRLEAIMLETVGESDFSKWKKMAWLIIDSMVDVIFIADVVINFMTSIVSTGGEVIMDPKVSQLNIPVLHVTCEIISDYTDELRIKLVLVGLAFLSAVRFIELRDYRVGIDISSINLTK